MREKMRFRWLIIGLLLPIALSLAGPESSPAQRLGPYGPNPDQLDPGVKNDSFIKLDAPFTLGQEIYYGRSKSVRGLNICLSVGDKGDKGGSKDDDPPEVVPVSRKLIRAFKLRRMTALTTRLVECAEPHKHIALILDRNEFRALIHFINKRFRLLLKD